MIKTIAWGIGANGPLEMTYSDTGKYIERDGVRYETAVDPAGSKRKYRETSDEIPDWRDPTAPETDESAEDDAEEV